MKKNLLEAALYIGCLAQYCQATLSSKGAWPEIQLRSSRHSTVAISSPSPNYFHIYSTWLLNDTLILPSVDIVFHLFEMSLQMFQKLTRTPLPSSSLPRIVRNILPKNQLRNATTSSTSKSAADFRSFTSLKSLLLGTTIGSALVVGGYYVTDTRASVHSLLPLIFRYLYADAEDAHEAGTCALKVLHSFGIHPRERGSPSGLEIEVWGQTLNNPIGTSAGIDKHCEIPDALMALGPAIVEIGLVQL